MVKWAASNVRSGLEIAGHKIILESQLSGSVSSQLHQHKFHHNLQYRLCGICLFSRWSFPVSDFLSLCKDMQLGRFIGGCKLPWVCAWVVADSGCWCRHHRRMGSVTGMTQSGRPSNPFFILWDHEKASSQSAHLCLSNLEAFQPFPQNLLEWWRLCTASSDQMQIHCLAQGH